MRHGETVTNARGLVTGSQDVPLTAVGEEQARRIGHLLDRHYDLALHSTLSRSVHTLRLALEAGRVEVDRIRSDPRLNERSLGVLELQPWRPVDEYAHGDLSYAPERGDSYAEVARRCLSLLIDLVDFVAIARPERILVSGHMGPMRILLGILEERSDPVGVLARSFENTEVVRVQWSRLVLPGFLEAVFRTGNVVPG
jgi:broad specificity phosphatase PhoE